MRGVVRSVLERRSSKGRIYWRVHVVLPSGKDLWLTSFEEPKFTPGEEIEFLNLNGVILPFSRREEALNHLGRCILALAAVQAGRVTPEEVAAWVEEVARFLGIANLSKS